MLKEGSALLLVGSASNAIGAPPETPGAPSPSYDPIGAAKAAFEGLGDYLPQQPLSLADRIGGVWSDVMDWYSEPGVVRPRAEGLAIFANTFPGTHAHLPEPIRRVTVGSPIYIRQVSQLTATGV